MTTERGLIDHAAVLIARYGDLGDKQVEDWLGAYMTLKVSVPCTAVIRHGPGRQSRTRCEERGPHETHYAANPMEPGWEWATDEAIVDDWGNVQERRRTE